MDYFNQFLKFLFYIIIFFIVLLFVEETFLIMVIYVSPSENHGKNFFHEH